MVALTRPVARQVVPMALQQRADVFGGYMVLGHGRGVKKVLNQSITWRVLSTVVVTL